MLAVQTFPLWVDEIAITAGAMLGAIAALRRQAPLVGIVMVGVITGLGGGILRDLVLNADIAAFRGPLYLPTVLLAIFIALPLHRVIPRTPGMTIGIDAFGMGAFVVAGAEKALTYGMGPTQSALIGVLCATGGGVIADLLMGEKPLVMQRGRWYVSAATVGAVYFVIGINFLPVAFMRVSTVVLVILLRELSERLGWDAPTADLLTGRRRSDD
jgi:uncharacterized membrane protein YeiH